MSATSLTNQPWTPWGRWGTRRVSVVRGSLQKRKALRKHSAAWTASYQALQSPQRQAWRAGGRALRPPAPARPHNGWRTWGDTSLMTSWRSWRSAFEDRGNIWRRLPTGSGSWGFLNSPSWRRWGVTTLAPTCQLPKYGKWLRPRLLPCTEVTSVLDLCQTKPVVFKRVGKWKQRYHKSYFLSDFIIIVTYLKVICFVFLFCLLGFNSIETKLQTPDGKVWKEEDFHHLSIKIYRDLSRQFAGKTIENQFQIQTSILFVPFVLFNLESFFFFHDLNFLRFACCLCLQKPPGRGISRRGSKDQSDLEKGGLQNQWGKSTELPLLLSSMQSLVNIPFFLRDTTHSPLVYFWLVTIGKLNPWNILAEIKHGSSQECPVLSYIPSEFLCAIFTR